MNILGREFIINSGLIQRKIKKSTKPAHAQMKIKQEQPWRNRSFPNTYTKINPQSLKT